MISLIITTAPTGCDLLAAGANHIIIGTACHPLSVNVNKPDVRPQCTCLMLFVQQYPYYRKCCKVST